MPFYIPHADANESSRDLTFLPSLPITLPSPSNDIRRKKRSQNSLNPVRTSSPTKIFNSDVWPPVSRDNWMKVVVVADGPMLKYHGDKLERYILTLMQTVSCWSHYYHVTS